MENNPERANPFRQRSILFQMIVLFVTLTVIATGLTGLLVYNSASSALIDNAWVQNETLLEIVQSSINRQFLQVSSFAWQISNNDKVISALYAREQTPKTILNERDVINVLQSMKAFMDTIADIGIHLYHMDVVITGEGSYNAQDYYRQISQNTDISMSSLFTRNADHSTLTAYAGKHTISRLISKVEVLSFVSDLPLSGSKALGYSFINLKIDKLKELLPASDEGFLLLVDDNLQPLLTAENEDDNNFLQGICDVVKDQGISRRLNYNGATYGVLMRETDVSGLNCLAIIPYLALLKQASSIRFVTMLIIGGCIFLGLLMSVFMSRKMYAPVALLINGLKLLENSNSGKDKVIQNEIAFISEVVESIIMKNEELTLSNRQIYRLLKNKLLLELMEGRLLDNEKTQQALLKSGIQLPHTQIQVAVFDLSLKEHGIQALEKKLGTDISEWAEQEIAPSSHGALLAYVASRADGRLLVLFNISTKHNNPEVIYDLMSKLKQSLEMQQDIACSVGVGRAYLVGAVGCANSLIDAMLALRSNMPASSNGIWLAEESDEAIDALPIYSLQAEEQLINRVKSGQKDLVAQQLAALYSQSDSYGIRGDSTAHALLFTAQRIAQQAGAEEVFLQYIEHEGIRPWDVPGVTPELGCIQDLYSTLIDGLHRNRNTQDKLLYDRMLEYIYRQYAHDISLGQLSDYMQMSPSYVGLVFRRVGGESFGKYVSDYRILKAKELLDESHLTIRRVGELVGIDNQNTFIRVFKKIAGITPGQYRKTNMTTDTSN